MAQVQVGGGGVEAELDAQLPPARKLFDQLFLDDYFVSPPTNGLNGLHKRCPGRFAPRRFFARLAQASDNQGILAEMKHRTLIRAAAAAALAVFGAVAAFATMAPPEVAAKLAPTALVENLPIPPEALLPPPASYIREERFQRGDTIAAFLARLGVAPAHIEKLARVRMLHNLRPGFHVGAE